MTFYHTGGSPSLEPKVDEIGQRVAFLSDQLAMIGSEMLRCRQSQTALEAIEMMRGAERKAHMPVRFRSQHGEDITIWEMLGRPLDGFFIEAGAFDGESYSVSYALEAIGWRGLLVEPIPEKFELAKARRPRSRVVHTALGKRGVSGHVTFKVAQDRWGGMLSHMPVEMGGDHAEGVEGQRDVTVPITSLDELLKDYRGAIDAVSLDVEGFELQVLDGFDLRRFKPRVILLEDNSRGQDDAIPRYMSAFPYEFSGWVGTNRIFIHHDEPQIMQRLRTM